MKSKITLLVVSAERGASPEETTFARVFLTEKMQPPSRYISTKEVSHVIMEMSQYYFNMHPRWLTFEIADFRKSDIDECEAVYICYMPIIDDACKNGKFIPHNQLKLDSYYARVLSGRSFRFE